MPISGQFYGRYRAVLPMLGRQPHAVPSHERPSRVGKVSKTVFLNPLKKKENFRFFVNGRCPTPVGVGTDAPTNRGGANQPPYTLLLSPILFLNITRESDDSFVSLEGKETKAQQPPWNARVRVCVRPRSQPPSPPPRFLTPPLPPVERPPKRQINTSIF